MKKPRPVLTQRNPGNLERDTGFRTGDLRLRGATLSINWTNCASTLILNLPVERRTVRDPALGPSHCSSFEAAERCLRNADGVRDPNVPDSFPSVQSL